MSAIMSSDNLADTWKQGNGRDPETGRLLPGHKVSVGNKGNRHRKRLLDGISDDDVDAALVTIREVMKDVKGKGNDRLCAARELLDRCTGKPAASDLSDRVEAIETSLERILQHLEIGTRE